MSRVIHPRAHKLAFQFVADLFDNLPHATHDEARSDLTFAVELWLHGIAPLIKQEVSDIDMVRQLTHVSRRFYSNDFASAAHDPLTKLDILQCIGCMVLDYLAIQPDTPVYTLFETWYDLASTGYRNSHKYGSRHIYNPYRA